jgi:hypothetical protein
MLWMGFGSERNRWIINTTKPSDKSVFIDGVNSSLHCWYSLGLYIQQYCTYEWLSCCNAFDTYRSSVLKNDYDTLFTVKKININYSISRYDYFILLNYRHSHIQWYGVSHFSVVTCFSAWQRTQNDSFISFYLMLSFWYLYNKYTVSWDHCPLCLFPNLCFSFCSVAHYVLVSNMPQQTMHSVARAFLTFPCRSRWNFWRVVLIKQEAWTVQLKLMSTEILLYNLITL